MKQSFKKHIAFLLLATVLFAALPKAYIHQMLGHQHHTHHSDKLTFSENNEPIDCVFEKQETQVDYINLQFYPDFFTVIQFALVIINAETEGVIKNHYNSSQLRGPPVDVLVI